MKMRQSPAPFLALLAMVIGGIQLADHALDQHIKDSALEIHVKPLKQEIAEVCPSKP